MQGELLVGVKWWADLEGGRGRGTNAGQHLRLAECLRQSVARGMSCIALQVSKWEGPRPQVWRCRLGRRWHTVQRRVAWHHMWRSLTCLGTFCLHGVIICLKERENQEQWLHSMEQCVNSYGLLQYNIEPSIYSWGRH